MKYTKLPGTEIEVSKICLGTMTWGEQNTEAEGHAQMDLAFEKGVNFFDTAELYPVPARPETQGLTETYIGTWFKKTGHRDKIILATKIAGPGMSNQHIRKGCFTKEELNDAIGKSLKRLQTDYLDLYQLHWPERKTNFFGKRGYRHQTDDAWEDNFRQVLEDLSGFVKEGKIRHIGISNETTYGIMRYLEESKLNGLPKMITVQNPYSLLNRLFEVGSAEVCIREEIGLLPYSPLGFGRLTNKYLDGTNPADARLNLFSGMSRYNGENALKATQQYFELSRESNLSLAQMALAFINQQPFVTSNIIGATNLDQLKENIESIDVVLSAELLKKIDAIHEAIPNPAP